MARKPILRTRVAPATPVHRRPAPRRPVSTKTSSGWTPLQAIGFVAVCAAIFFGGLFVYDNLRPKQTLTVQTTTAGPATLAPTPAAAPAAQQPPAPGPATSTPAVDTRPQGTCGSGFWEGTRDGKPWCNRRSWVAGKQ